MKKHETSIEIITNDQLKQNEHDLALSVLEGLSCTPKSLPSKLFYDDKGSDLFKQIMQLDEYYPTRSEAEIITIYGKKVANHLKAGTYNIIELGCGDGAKTIRLLNSFLQEEKDFHFIPLDISKVAVEFLIENMHKEYGTIPFTIKGLVAEYFQGLSWLSENASKQNMVLFLGSNIGNFNKPTSLRFLRNLWYSLNKDDLVFIGFDLKKDLDVLYDAYNDKKGITKEFNFNVLDRINEKLGGNFDRKNFQHQGLYNIQTGAMESYLISMKEQSIWIEDLGKSFSLRPWEAIHMEYSYKYLKSDIEYLARNSGFEVIENYTDSKNYFMNSLWRVKK